MKGTERMKNRWIIAIFLVIGMVSVGHAQTTLQSVRVTIPFQFAAGNNSLPAGQYVISTMKGSLIQFRNEKTHDVVTQIAPREVNRSSQNHVLVFSGNRQHWVLTDIFDDAMSVSIPVGHKANMEHAQVTFVPIL